jgi:hypothetical protein
MEHQKVEYLLNLNVGDAYSRDVEMQKTYVHGIPARKNNSDHLLVVVFRWREMRVYKQDMGKPCIS